MKTLTAHEPGQRNPQHTAVRALAACLSAAVVLGAGTASAAGLLVADGGFGGVLTIKEQNVKAVINNGIAVTEVTQVFRNTENRQVEALYTFPVPNGASVANFSMWINGKEMVGEVVEKERAREIYNSYKRQRRDPGLLEQVDYKTFEMRIFPIAPRAEQQVQIVYYQELNQDSDWATYVYPLATVSGAGMNQRCEGGFSLNLEVKSAVPITTMESPSHQDEFVFAEYTDAYCQASMELEQGDLSRDVVVAYRLARPRTGIDMIAFREPGEDGYFCMTITAGKELEDLNAGMDYVFIMDVSGSMGNDGKLSLSRESIGAFVKTLSEDDRTDVITFNIQAAALFNELRPVTGTAQEEVLTFLDTRKARGGTVLGPALTAAYRYRDPDRALNVVVLSDGMTEQKERQALAELIRTRPANVRVFCIGVGNEVNRPLLREIAEGAGGLAAFISRGDNFARQAAAFRRKLIHPVATQLGIKFDSNTVYDVEPRQLPNLYHGMPVRLYGRYSKPGPAALSLNADVAGRDLTMEVPLDFPKMDTTNPEIKRMWAWHRVDRLKRDSRSGDMSKPKAVDEIIRLGELYSIVTEHTSFLVLENDAEYQRWSIKRQNLLAVRAERRSQQELRVALEALRAKSVAGVGPVTPADPAAPRRTVVASNSRTTTPAGPTQPSQPQPGRSRSLNVDLPIGGGGALDPLSVGIVAGLSAVAVASRRRKRDSDTDEQ